MRYIAYKNNKYCEERRYRLSNNLIVAESYAGEGLGLMELTVKYKANTHEEVTVPVKLLAEPTTCDVEDELSVFVKLKIAGKVNGERK